MKPAIEVIVVNFNAGEALQRCVRSVLAQELPLRLTVVDNASSDGSEASLRQHYGHDARLVVIDNEGNPGFAKAINGAIIHKAFESAAPPLESEYLLILNPDCEMLAGSLGALREALDEDPGAALAAPLVVDRKGAPLRGTLRKFPDPWKSFLAFSGLWRLGRRYIAFEGVDMSGKLPGATSRADAVSGACMLLRKSVFLELGGLDEAYGLHCEDLDLMYRLHQRGSHRLFVPAAQVYHEQGVSSRSRRWWVHWQKHRGMQRFFLKFQAPKYGFPMRWLVITGIWTRFLVTLPLLPFRH